jgi:muramoyltetrapeptide carboxypeptidase
MNTRTRAGMRKARAAGPGSRVRLVAPASPFDRSEFEAGVRELARLGFVPVHDERVFERQGYVAGSAVSRAAQLRDAWADDTVDAIIGVRGGYGSVQLLPSLTPADVGTGRPASFVGYSDLTTLHSWLGCQVGVTSIHGPMLERRLSVGTTAYDVASFLGSLTTTPLGELTPDGLEGVRPGEAAGPLLGGTLSQLLGSLGTPYAFAPPQGYVLFLDEVGERPYRLDRMLVQATQAGLLARASAVIVGQLPSCDEPGSGVTGRAVVADALAAFPGPVLLGFPSGHTTTPLVTLPIGVHTRVVSGPTPRVIVEESAVAQS